MGLINIYFFYTLWGALCNNYTTYIQFVYEMLFLNWLLIIFVHWKIPNFIFIYIKGLLTKSKKQKNTYFLPKHAQNWYLHVHVILISQYRYQLSAKNEIIGQ